MRCRRGKRQAALNTIAILLFVSVINEILLAMRIPLQGLVHVYQDTPSWVVGEPNNSAQEKQYVLFVNDACNTDWRSRMGYTGECVQHDALLKAFMHLGIIFKEVEYIPCKQNQTAVNGCVSDVSISEEVCRDAAMMSRSPIVLGGMSHEVAGRYAEQMALCVGGGSEGQSRIRVALLSWFGVAPSHVPVHPHVPHGYEILSVMPAERNLFLGYSLDDLPHNSSSLVGEEKYGVVLGKLGMYFRSLKSRTSPLKKCSGCIIKGGMPNPGENAKEVLQRAAKHLPLKCAGCQAAGVTDVGKLGKEGWRALLDGSRLLLGMGDPIGSPSVLEAISLGCTVVLPQGRRKKNMNGREHVSQYDHLKELVRVQPSLKPYVCWYRTFEDLDDCVSRAANVVLPRITIDAFTPESFRARVKGWIFDQQT